MNIQYSPSNPIVRVIYCITLLSVAFSLLRNFSFFNFSKAISEGAVLLLLMALVPVLSKVALLALVAFRFIGIVIGKFTLTVFTRSGPIFILRMFALLLMFVSVAAGLYGIIGILLSSRSGGAGYGLLSGIMGGGSPIGLILFEASRLLEREMMSESNT